MKFADRYANANYRYLSQLGEFIYYTYRYDEKPRMSIATLLHEMEQGLTDIQRAYNGGKPCKWGCESSDEVIDKMNNGADKWFEEINKYKKKYDKTWREEQLKKEGKW